MAFGKAFMGHTESYLRGRHPTVPRHTRLYFTTMPVGVVFVLGRGDAPALRVWYADPTLEGWYWSEYRRRVARDSTGPDYFFRYDSLTGWSEVVRGPEVATRARAADRRWEADHATLAARLASGDDWSAAAEEYQKLAGARPDNPDYPFNRAVCLEAAGDTVAARVWYRHADSVAHARSRASQARQVEAQGSR
jgi:hypothetical protein